MKEPTSGTIPTSVAVKYAVRFGQQRIPKPEPSAAPATRVARMIALAHHIDDLIDRGVIESYGEVARALGVCDTRLVQIQDLALLSPRIQEALLMGEVKMSPRAAQKLVRLGTWAEQERGLGEVAIQPAGTSRPRSQESIVPDQAVEPIARDSSSGVHARSRRECLKEEAGSDEDPLVGDGDGQLSRRR
jgi:hypothetical protein